MYKCQREHPTLGWQRDQEAAETSPMGSSRENNKETSFFGNRGGQTQPNYPSL
ncbi:MAG: hypothetical protein GY696_23450 [Gammaproteobacteria bacterium]|nr:hypothetical protein [Gammaproteobacteria bacterium]